MNSLRHRILMLERSAEMDGEKEIVVLDLRPENWRLHAEAIKSAPPDALVITLTTYGDEVGAPEDYRLYKEAFQAITANNN